MTTSPYWGTFVFPWSQATPGSHLYPPSLRVNVPTGTLELFYGFTPNGSDSLSRYAVQLDPFFLPLPPLSASTDGYAFVDASTIFQTPLRQNLVLASTGQSDLQGIAVFQTQDSNGNNSIKESFVTGENGSLSAGPSTQIAGPLSGKIENTIFEPFRTSASVLNSYGVGWDQYNPATGAYSISFDIFNHNSGDPNFNGAGDYTSTGIVTLNLGTFTSETSLPNWTFAAAGGAYVVAAAFSFPGHDSILVNGYNLDGSFKSNGFTFRIDPDLSAYPGDANHIALQRDPATGQLNTASLSLVQQASPGNLYGIAWDESITDSSGNVVGNQVEFAIFQPLVGVVQRHTFQIVGSSPEKVRLQLESNNIFVLTYGDNSATHIVRFDTSGNVLATATDPTDHTFDSVAVLGDGRVDVLYDNILDQSGTSQIVSHVFDFRVTGVNINDFPLVDGNNKYVAGTQFSDFFIGESNTLNEFYDVDGIPFSPNFDSFTGGDNGFNVAIFPSARSNYVISELAGSLILSSKTNTNHFLQATNVQEFAFNPIVEPAPQGGVIDVTGGGVFLNSPLSNGLSAIIAGSTLELASPLTSTGQVTLFNFGTSTLRIDYPESFQGTISGLLPGDIINLGGIDPATTTALFDGSTLIVHTVGAAFQYHIIDAPAGGIFLVQSGEGGTDLVFSTSRASQTLSILPLDADWNDSISEATSFTFVVTRTGDTTGIATAHWAVSASQGAAATPSDFGGVFPGGTVTFQQGETSKTIEVLVAAHPFPENGGQPVHFTIGLSNPSSGTTIAPLSGSASGTIHDGALLPFMAELADAAYHLSPSESPVPGYNNPGGPLADSLYTSLLISNSFHFLTAADPDLSGLSLADTGTGPFSTKGLQLGIYHNDNAAALVGREGNSLFIAFRGTNDSTGGNDFENFLLGVVDAKTPDENDWSNMDHYYEELAPLLTALDNYISDKSNHVDNVYVTGHSLGAAMVQQYLTDYQHVAYLNRKFEGIAFADPGYFSILKQQPPEPEGNSQIINVAIQGDSTQGSFIQNHTWNRGDELLVTHSADRTGDLHDMGLYYQAALALSQSRALVTSNFDDVADPIPIELNKAYEVLGKAGMFTFTSLSYAWSPQGVHVSLSADDVLLGGHDVYGLPIIGLIGSSFGDVLTGNNDNNLLEGGPGDDVLDGAGGTNTAKFSGTISNYIWSKNADGTWTIKNIPGWQWGNTIVSLDGTDTLRNIQYLQFSDNTAPDGIKTVPINTVVGFVVKGHITGAVVFADANGNGRLDPSESVTTTDESGQFILPGGTGTLIALGGVDTSTGLQLKGQLSAPSDFHMITPLTTLVVQLQALAVLAPEQTVLSALGLPPTLDLSTLDPIAAAIAGDPAGAAAEVAAATVYDTASLSASALASAGDTFSAAAQASFVAIVNAINNGSVNLTDQASVSALIVSAAETQGIQLDQGTSNTLAVVIAASNSALPQASSQLTGHALIEAISTIEKLAQGAESAAVQRAAGDPSLLSIITNAFTGSNLTNALAPQFNDGNHAPWLATDTVAPHSMTEIAGKTGSNDLDAIGGKLLFTDADLSDTHQVSAALDLSSIKWMNADGAVSSTTLPIDTFNPLDHAIQAALVSDSTNGNIGEISWHFSAADHYFDFLAADETLSATFNIGVTDNHGATSVETVTILINGTNDNPTSVPDSNGVAKGTTLSVAASVGVLANDTDPDIREHLVVSAVNASASSVGHAVKGAYGSLTLNADGSYAYTASKGALPGQIVAQDTFSYTISDGHGGISTSTLSVVVSNPGVLYLSGANTTLTGVINGKDVLDGSARHNVLIGGNDPDVLIGGNGDTLTGGPGPDTFLFRPNFGTNVIADFNVTNDAIQFDKSIFANVSDVLNHTTNTAAGAIINNGHGDTITLTGITLAQLQVHQSDFHLI
ncbi:VCBS repeat-containing protein [Bradyrhizobium sp. USDA 3240]